MLVENNNFGNKLHWKCFLSERAINCAGLNTAEYEGCLIENDKIAKEMAAAYAAGL